MEWGECIWGNHLFSLLHLTELWKPSFAFHFIYTLFVWYVSVCVCVCVSVCVCVCVCDCMEDTLKESKHVSTVLLWSLSSADNYSAPFSHLSQQMRSNVLHFGTSDNPFPISLLLPLNFYCTWFSFEFSSLLLFSGLISRVRSQRSVMGHGVIL